MSLEEMALTSAGVSVVTIAVATGSSFSQVLLYDVETVTFPFVDILFHLEVKVGDT